VRRRGWRCGGVILTSLNGLGGTLRGVSFIPTKRPAMHPNALVITRFYDAFARRDAQAMARCYHPEVHFTDAVFDLRGAEAARMWHMLCTNGRDLTVVASGIAADAHTGCAHWDAHYTFSATGRHVLNRIDARFEFRDGLIVRHVDAFSFWRWSRQALGLPGWLLGWSGWLRNKVRAQAAKGLAAFVPPQSAA
jgi:ketosteroid isomerase-like protein